MAAISDQFSAVSKNARLLSTEKPPLFLFSCLKLDGGRRRRRLPKIVRAELLESTGGAGFCRTGLVLSMTLAAAGRAVLIWEDADQQLTAALRVLCRQESEDWTPTQRNSETVE